MKNTHPRFSLKQVAITKSYLEVDRIGYGLGDKSSFDITTSHERRDNNTIISYVEVSLINGEEGAKQQELKINVRVVGEFEIKGNDLDSKEAENEQYILNFALINAPAIIYPYVRQHVRHLTLEANFRKPLILPVINFVEYHKQMNNPKLSKEK